MSFSSGDEAEPSSSSYSPQQCREFTLPEIVIATNNFDESRLLGSGGFAKVYRGTITYGEKLLDVAIKRLTPGLSEGTSGFWYEVAMLSKLRHSHLVSQIGYCSDGQEKIFVYDYLPLGTLEDHLHKGRFPLSWVRRLKICLDSARGLEYLHSETDAKSKVLHLDFKSSNILLASNWAAKISDFGLSKVRPTESAYLTDHVGGTLGYLDPHFQLTGEATRKTDVFAFGVVMFEVLCGKKAYPSIDGKRQFLRAWAQESIKKGRLKQIIDSNLEGRISTECLKKFAVLADKCLHSRPVKRPTMADVVKDLESILAVVNREFGPLWGYNEELVGGENLIIHQFDFNTIVQATDNFSEANKLLSVTRGTDMYKGRLQSGQAITIAKRSSYAYREFENEVSTLAKVEHKIVVQLLGLCIDGPDRYLYLVYDFATNASLDNLLFDHECDVLDWNNRYKIILGVARGLVYLHNHAPIRTIHRCVGPVNILLDASFEPKLSGFGYAKENYDSGDVVDNIYGKFGYIAPEYLLKSRPTTKADVFSLGVLILNIVTGQRACDGTRVGQEMLDHYVQSHWFKGTLSDIVDPRIKNVEMDLTTKLIKIGLLCCQVSDEDRPTMEEVVGMLLGTSTLLVRELEPWMYRRPSTDGLSEEDYNVEDYDVTAVGDFLSELCPR